MATLPLALRVSRAKLYAVDFKVVFFGTF